MRSESVNVLIQNSAGCHVDDRWKLEERLREMGCTQRQRRNLAVPVYRRARYTVRVCLPRRSPWRVYVSAGGYRREAALQLGWAVRNR